MAAALLSSSMAQRTATAVVAPAPADPLPKESAEGTRRANVCSASNPVGVGLRGEYFAAAHWQGRPGAIRIDTSLEFASPAELAGSAAASPRSVRWTGWVKVPVSGRYRFDGGHAAMRITVANLLMSGKEAAPDAGIELAAGRFYAIKVELDEPGIEAYPVKLVWITPYGARYGIPRQLLFLPTDSVGS